jgi:adenosylcobinamide-phosphate synthase
MIEATTAEFAIAVMLDLIIGDPRWLPHPVEGIGFLVRRFERLLRRIMPYERAAGSVLVFMVLSVSLVFTAATLRWGGSPVAVYWIFSCLALRSLDQHALRVIEALRSGDLNVARNLVGQIVGRDTGKLSENEITRAVFETIAENLSDGVVAPLFFLAVAGIPGMLAYKAINTMDSMIGHKNESYIRFGWAAARLDDLANYIPARITAGLIVLSAALLRLRWRSAAAIILRDARLQPSPNAGYPEAALAGALGVQLGGLNYYFGRRVHKPFLGDPIDELQWSRFATVRWLMYGVAGFSYLALGIWLQF